MSRNRKKTKLAVGDLRKEIVRRIDRAIDDVHQTDSREDELIHDARRSCKRVRAYLELFAEFDPAVAKQASKSIRNAARELSPFRDRQIIPEAIKRVRTCLDQSNSANLQTILRSMTLIGQEATQAADPDRPIERALNEATRKLEKARKRVKSCQEFDAQRIRVSALERSYSAARQSIARVRKSGSPESFHELRKAVKAHFYQCQFVAALCKKLLGPRIKSLRKLGETLGAAQDVAVLRRAIDHQSGLTDDETEICHRMCDEVAGKMHEESLVQATQLFFDAGDEFIDEVDGAR